MPNAMGINNNEILHVENVSESGILTELKNESISRKLETATIISRLEQLEELLCDLVNKMEGKDISMNR